MKRFASALVIALTLVLGARVADRFRIRLAPSTGQNWSTTINRVPAGPIDSFTVAIEAPDGTVYGPAVLRKLVVLPPDTFPPPDTVPPDSVVADARSLRVSFAAAPAGYQFRAEIRDSTGSSVSQEVRFVVTAGAMEGGLTVKIRPTAPAAVVWSNGVGGSITIETAGSTPWTGPWPDSVVVPPPDTVAPGASPHFPHARFAAIDYRIHYLSAALQAVEYPQAAGRYDVVVGGKASEWKPRNPTVRQYVYDLIVGDEQADVPVMNTWLTANGFTVEAAYLHVGGQRVSYHQWTADYYGLNVGDPGYRAWRQHRTAQLLAGGYDGVFFDVLGSGSGGIGVIPQVTDEYPTRAAYTTALHELLALTASWSPSGRCLANTGNYLAAEDAAQADSCRGVVMEFANDVYGEIGYTMWGFVGARLAAGTQVMMVPQRQGYLKNTPRYDMNPGNYGTVAERLLLAEYANYLMLMDPQRADQLAIDFYLTGNTDPANPHAVTWLKAYERDLGAPLAARRVLTSGTDGAGQPYQAFAREFANALVIYRPMQNWARTKFGDATAVAISLPAGTWRLLRADGSMGAALTSVNLRNGEAVILVR